MQACQARDAFEAFVAQQGLTLERLLPDQATALMIAFYEQVAAEDVDSSADGDMLLFQWGTYDWGDGAFFTYTMTRQLITSETRFDDDGEWADETILQLSLTLKYEPTATLRSVQSGNYWCHHPGAVEQCRAFIRAAEATRAVLGTEPVAIELRFDNAE